MIQLPAPLRAFGLFPKIIDANANKSRLANHQKLRCCKDIPRLGLIEINDEHEKDQKLRLLLKIQLDKRRPSNDTKSG